ncbi:hypothetical protein MTP03_23750 [Tsukamurella sp. PLM1]|nr:hypothetical protein MTP03_23750 [Tsukamurella sp. PLM1]
MYARGFTARVPMRVLSPRMDPPLRVDDGSTASTATLCPNEIRWLPRASMVVDFHPGHAGDPHAGGDRRVRSRRHLEQQLLREGLMVGAPGLDEGDGARQHGALVGPDPVREFGDGDHASWYPSLFPSSCSRFTAASAMTVPGG